MRNQDIRAEIETARLRYWQVAAEYGCTDSTFSKKMRAELPENEKEKIRSIISKLVGGRDANA